MEHLQPTSVFSLLETNKEQRASFVNQVIQSLENGETDVLRLHHQVKCMEQMLSDLKDRPEYKEMLLSEASKHGKKFELHNAEFQIKEAGTKWDYKNTGDTTYTNLIIQKIQLDAQIKAREKMLQSLPTTGLADAETGEMLYPPVKTSQTIVSITLK